MALAIFLTGDLLRECAFNSRTSAFDQERCRLARLFAIVHLSKQKSPDSAGAEVSPSQRDPSLATARRANLLWPLKLLRSNQTERRTQVSFKGPGLEIEPHSLRSYFCGLKLLNERGEMPGHRTRKGVVLIFRHCPIAESPTRLSRAELNLIWLGEGWVP
jgi:hypothetical protein